MGMCPYMYMYANSGLPSAGKASGTLEKINLVAFHKMHQFNVNSASQFISATAAAHREPATRASSHLHRSVRELLETGLARFLQ